MQAPFSDPDTGQSPAERASALELNAHFWEERYRSGETGWDLGGISPPLKNFFDTWLQPGHRILIPGCGRAYEAEYLWQKGFAGVHVLDWSQQALDALQERCPDFPPRQLIAGDFFEHEGQYDLVVEQTFFCAIDPLLRSRYVEKVHSLLAPEGLLAGLLFDDPLNADRPPFGGSEGEYRDLFQPLFDLDRLHTAPDSVQPRAGRELFILARRR